MSPCQPSGNFGSLLYYLSEHQSKIYWERGGMETEKGGRENSFSYTQLFSDEASWKEEIPEELRMKKKKKNDK